ncbi:MAG: YraN family protein [Chitinophagaceae bacterium]|nr:YraN family protein [Chitinophagaceae bacterium]
MARHNETGKLGEQLARNWVESNGYSIRNQNWRYGHWEIDLVVSKAGRLHFFEVKTYFISAGTAYIRINRGFKWVQYDILSISLDEHDQPTFFLIEDVYF